MKIRTDYVSNSSSCSFVFSNMDIFVFFKITKQDILDALIDSYGEEEYKQYKLKMMETMKSDPQFFNKKQFKLDELGPFYVYDLSDPNDRNEAISRWGNLLKGWNATNCVFDVDESPDSSTSVLCGERETIHKYSETIDNMADIFNVSPFDLMWVAEGGNSEDCQMFIRSDVKDPKTGLMGHYEPLPQEVANAVRMMRKKAGIMNNLDVIKSKCARFFIHADDNAITSGRVYEYGKADDCEYDKDAVKHDWDTEMCSYERVCEVVLKYLVKKGKIVPDDPKFLEYMRIDDKYLTDKDKEMGFVYDFANCKNLSWEDLKSCSMTWNMHEG